MDLPVLSNRGRLLGLLLALLSASSAVARADGPQAPLQAGFAEADITPRFGDQPVYLAGFGQNRKATGVHDPLKARAVVLRHGEDRLAIVSVDVVGLFHASVLRVRQQLAGFRYVLVTSTHNHQGPDTLGLWGPNPFKSGVDPAYLKLLEERIVQAVRTADAAAREVTARLGAVRAPELLHDAREPFLKHDELAALEFLDGRSGKPAGIIVQWNCHPETLGKANTQLSADFVGWTVKELAERHQCPVVYLTGTVGGLMTSLQVPVQDEKGQPLADGTVAKTERYGRLVGQAADRALRQAGPIRLTPIEVRSRSIFLPIQNPAYRLAWQIGVLDRQGYLWTGDLYQAQPCDADIADKPICLRTEVAWLRLGELEVAAIPGEIYPELVLGKVQDPPDPGADFPDAPIEPAIYDQLAARRRMIIGLANDEIGYIIPKRQWDQRPPFCYGRRKSQYGEINSLGPETAPLVCRAFRELVAAKPER
jgi:hypothetical protein